MEPDKFLMHIYVHEIICLWSNYAGTKILSIFGVSFYEILIVYGISISRMSGSVRRYELEWH